MTIITKTHALNVIRHAYGPEVAQSLAGRLPDRMDLDNAQDARLLFELGLTPDGLANALGGEM